jgi:hypothetical protein
MADYLNFDKQLGMVVARKGYAKSNRYRVDINLPRVINEQIIKGYSLEQINMLCESVTMPSRALSTNEYTNGTQTKKIPYTYIDEDVVMEFNLSGDYYPKLVMDNWIESILQPDGFVAQYKNNFVADIQIYGQDINDNNVYKINLINAYPISVGDIQLSNANENTIGKFQVSFAYDRFEYAAGGITNMPPPIVNVPSALNGLAGGRFGGIFGFLSDLNGEFSTLNNAVNNFNTNRSNLRNLKANVNGLKGIKSISGAQGGISGTSESISTLGKSLNRLGF